MQDGSLFSCSYMYTTLYQYAYNQCLAMYINVTICLELNGFIFLPYNFMDNKLYNGKTFEGKNCG